MALDVLIGPGGRKAGRRLALLVIGLVVAILVLALALGVWPP